jgi:hypothetical protein
LRSSAIQLLLFGAFAERPVCNADARSMQRHTACPLNTRSTLRRERKRRALMVSWLANRYREERGAIGYIILWALGVPASVLFVIFLLRGCN